MIDYLEAEGASPWSCVAVAVSDDPPSTQRPHGAPGAPLRPLAIARRGAPGAVGSTYRWGPDLLGAMLL